MEDSLAYRKLSEASFFLLQHLKVTLRPPHQDNYPEGVYYLSAFLSAARSVTFYLQKEHGRATYKEWFQRWRKGLPEEDDELLDFMKAQRNSEVHEQGASTLIKSKGASKSLPWANVDQLYFEFKGVPVEVVDLCERYLKLLERLVKEFIAYIGHGCKKA